MGDDEYPWDDGDTDECDHLDYDLDILTGRASCETCSHCWYLTDTEMKAHEERARAAYQAWEEPESPNPAAGRK